MPFKPWAKICDSVLSVQPAGTEWTCLFLTTASFRPPGPSCIIAAVCAAQGRPAVPVALGVACHLVAQLLYNPACGFESPTVGSVR